MNTTEGNACEFVLTSSAATDVGRVREMNEDSFISSSPVYLVADGMGGHNAGEVASAVVVDEFLQLSGTSVVDLDDVADALLRAYERISSLDDESSRSAGTTVALVTLTEHEGAPHWLIMNLGDSRVYSIRGGEFSQVSVDHSVVQELIDRGEISPEQARVHPYRNMITRALGAGPDAKPDFWLLEAHEGDRFLLCSDGVSGEIPDEDLERIFSNAREEDNVAQLLVDEAVRRGGHDNATAVTVAAVSPAVGTGHVGEFEYTTVPRSELPQLPGNGPDEALTRDGRGTE